MDEGINWWSAFAGWASLILSAISLYLNVSLSRTNEQLMTRLMAITEHESQRVDQLIRTLTRRRRRR